MGQIGKENHCTMIPPPSITTMLIPLWSSISSAWQVWPQPPDFPPLVHPYSFLANLPVRLDNGCQTRSAASFMVQVWCCQVSLPSGTPTGGQVGLTRARQGRPCVCACVCECMLVRVSVCLYCTVLNMLLTHSSPGSGHPWDYCLPHSVQRQETVECPETLAQTISVYRGGPPNALPPLTWLGLPHYILRLGVDPQSPGQKDDLKDKIRICVSITTF